ncbi:hypothetical protein CAPTEDRAFT_176056 [Capitella teleta]|uniref:Cadherin domain-containing protein n=1 Tax=Capitella teleta TaxID=283909 RepID=R7VJ33_CAPTE|nr:hypothetical protein CAPTEDRAFT_176056 [Capitella teleta]|eukprot:ELU18572.1 hypothetical protein CAPTEDRAFT_176056 [Capitella teleta]
MSALLWIITVFVARTSCAITNTLTYTVLENIPRDSIVANVLLDAGYADELAPEVYRTLEISIVDPNVPGAHLFTIANKKDISAALKLDREAICVSATECIVNLDVQVSPHQYFQIIKVSIAINDSDDNVPSFQDREILRTISESSNPGSVISLPLAIDRDSPENGIAGYTLTDASGKFDLIVTNTSSEIQSIFLSLKEKLDRETSESYRVVVEANGVDGRSGRMTVVIEVQDVNDNLPNFEKQNYDFEITEDVDEGFIIGSVVAADLDSGDNGVVIYEIEDQNLADVIFLNSSTGVLSSMGAMDRDTVETYTFRVTARNKDPNSLSSFTTVTLTVLDVNDNAPLAKIRGSDDDQTVHITESASIDSFVAHITISDPDKGENGTFDCAIQSTHFDLIQLFKTEYKLVTKHSLDRESQAAYNIDINCQDHGSVPQASSKTVTVVVDDENDNAPRFGKSMYSGSLLENNHVGVFLVSVQAMDPDEGSNGTVRYALDAESNTHNLLRIDASSGNITANVPFDHELSHHRRIEVQVIARDQGTPVQSSTVSVIISVIDIDDERPRFEKPVYSLGVFENQPIQTEVGIVEAYDKDSELFNRFHYELDYNEQDANAFTIDPDSGHIYTSEVLDRETKADYHFTVSAISEGLHPKSDIAAVHVYIADTNDNAPMIHFPNFKNNTIHISNRTPLSTVLTTVEAEDVDANSNARISFAIVSGNVQEHFDIDANTGVLILAKEVSKIDHRLFGLVISVKDHGDPPRASEAFLNIIVNKSITSPSTGLMSSHNLTIVIAIATVSGLLMVVLLVGIALILRYPRISSCNSKYNQTARAMMSQTLDVESLSVHEKVDPHSDSLHQIHNDLGVGQRQGGNADLSFVNLSFQDDTKDLLSQQDANLRQIAHPTEDIRPLRRPSTAPTGQGILTPTHCRPRIIRTRTERFWCIVIRTVLVRAICRTRQTADGVRMGQTKKP